MTQASAFLTKRQQRRLLRARTPVAATALVACMVRYARAERRRGGTGRTAIAIDKMRDEELLRDGLVADSYPNFYESREACHAGMRVLDSRERVVVEKTLDGCTLGEIAAALAARGEARVSSNRIRQLQIRARTKIVRALQGENRPWPTASESPGRRRPRSSSRT